MSYDDLTAGCSIDHFTVSTYFPNSLTVFNVVINPHISFKKSKKKSFRSRDTWNVDVGWAVMEKVREDCITAQLSHEIITKCFPSPGLSSETFLFVFCVNNKKNYYQPWLVITKILFAPNQIAHQSCTASHKKKRHKSCAECVVSCSHPLLTLSSFFSHRIVRDILSVVSCSRDWMSSKHFSFRTII